MTVVHLGMVTAKRMRARYVPDDMKRAAVLAALDVEESPWDDESLRDALRGRPEQVGTLDDAPRVMDVHVSPESSTAIAAQEVLACWAEQTDDPAAAWAWSDSPLLLGLLVEHFGCPDAPPVDVEATHHTAAGPPGESDGTEWGPKPTGGVKRGKVPKSPLAFAVDGLDLQMLHTSAGIDHLSRVGFDISSNATATYAAANYIAVTENATAPSTASTALTGELSGSGWTRAQTTYAHTNGTATVVLTKTFTSADASARTLNKVGLFNASATGTLAYETAVPSPPTLVSGDSTAFTWTFTVS